MIKNIAKIISGLFYPLLIPTYGVLFLFSLQTPLLYMPLELKKISLIIVVACTLVLPISIIPLLIKLKLVNNIYMSTRKERFIPLLYSLFCYTIGYYLLSLLHTPRIIMMFYAAAEISIILTAIITVFWKISIHTISIGAFWGLMLIIWNQFGINTFFWMNISLIASGLVASSRLALGSHNIYQVYAGFLLGASSIIFISLL